MNDDHVIKINKRRYPRFIVKVLMDYEEDATFRFILDKADSEAYLFDYSTNFSEGGIFIRTTKKLPLNSPVHLRFYLPNSEQLIEATGKVAWINDETSSPLVPGIGIQFLKLTTASLDIIQEFIRTSLGGHPTKAALDEK